MSRGQEVELFTEYGPAYDEMRNRQGYGPRKGVKPDCHFPSRLERDNDDRSNAKQIIEGVDNFPELTGYLIYASETWELLNELPTLDIRLVIAMARIQWLLAILEDQLEALCEAFTVDFELQHPSGSIEWYHQGAVRACRELIQGMRILAPKSFYDNKLSSAFNIVLKETQEQVLFALSEPLAWPCEESVWAPVGTQLLLQFSLDIARWKLGVLDETTLRQQLAKHIDDAISMTRDVGNLAFESGLREYDMATFDVIATTGKVRRLLQATMKTRISRLLFNDKTPKALLATALETASMELSDLWNGLFVMSPFTLGGDCYRVLSSCPCPLNSTKKCLPNILWYKVWQIG
jgi:hypothetical protein